MSDARIGFNGVLLAVIGGLARLVDLRLIFANLIYVLLVVEGTLVVLALGAAHGRTELRFVHAIRLERKANFAFVLPPHPDRICFLFYVFQVFCNVPFGVHKLMLVLADMLSQFVAETFFTVISYLLPAKCGRQRAHMTLLSLGAPLRSHINL